MAENITDERAIFLECASWDEAIEVDNSATAKISSLLICIINGIFVVHSVLLNSLIVAVYHKDHRLQTTSNILMVALAMVDLFVGLLAQPVAVVNHGLKLYGIHSCSLEMLSLYTTEFTVGLSCTIVFTAIAVERFLAIMFPLKHRRLVTKRRLTAAVFTLSLFSAFTAVTFVSAFSLRVIFAIQFSFIVLGMTFSGTAYARIHIRVQEMKTAERIRHGANREKGRQPVLHLQSKIKRTGDCSCVWTSDSNSCQVCQKIMPSVSHENHNVNNRPISQKANHKLKTDCEVCKSMAMILGALIICFLPRCISLLCYIIGVINPQTFYSYILPWTDVTGYFNSSLNPYIYFFRNKDIGEATKRILVGMTPTAQRQREFGQ